MPQEQAQHILRGIDKEDSAEVRELLKYDKETAGGIMQFELVAVQQQLTVQDAIEHIRASAGEVEDLHHVFIVDDAKKLVGILPLRKLILASPASTVGSIRSRSPSACSSIRNHEGSEQWRKLAATKSTSRSTVLTQGLTTGFGSTYLTKIGDVVVNREAVEATTFGVSDEQYIIGVMKKRDPLVIEGFYDDTASSGPDAILNIGKVTHAVTRSTVLTCKSGKTVTGEVWIEKYTRTLEVGNYHGFSASLRYSGTITEA